MIDPDDPMEPPAACSLCGAVPTDASAVITWTLEVDGDEHRWLCIPCTREHARDIEGHLSLQDWLGVG